MSTEEGLTPEEYQLLSAEEQEKYKVARWSRYKTIVTTYSCYECSSIIRGKDRVPAKNAKPLWYVKINPLFRTFAETYTEYADNLLKNLKS